MEDGTWEDFLDIIGLTEKERRLAVLNVIRKIPGGNPKYSVLDDLFEISTRTFNKRVTALHLFWFNSILIVLIILLVILSTQPYSRKQLLKGI
ncbi:hypothetical protein [Halobacillus mangrovi]|uniref:hypothetical protein n=1 Tax=Halobacillus mangrovi TaxID=402384 RepID=UPI003D9648C0